MVILQKKFHRLFPPKIIDESIYEKEPIFWSGQALCIIVFISPGYSYLFAW